MSDYLYAVIPYNSGLQFHEDAEDKFICGMPKELEGIPAEIDNDCYYVFSDFILINTCWRMSSLNCDDKGWCEARGEIYKVAEALNVSEVWYVEELGTDKMMESDFNFDEWKKSLKDKYAYCTCEVTLDMLRNQRWASYCHDDFSDIVINDEYFSDILKRKQYLNNIKEIAKVVFDIDYKKFLSLNVDGNSLLSINKNSEYLPYPIHFITICWDIVFGYVLQEWKNEYRAIVAKRKVENDKFKAFFSQHDFDMKDIPFSDYWEVFYCDAPDDTVEECLCLTEEELKERGFRDIDIELACCVNKFMFERVKQLLEQGADPMKNWAEDKEEHQTCVTRIYSEIQFLHTEIMDKILGKENLDNFERDLCDLFGLTAHEKMDHLLDKYH